MSIAPYLTQILMPVRDVIGRLRVRDSYDWHQKLWEIFPNRDAEARDFLSRIDRSGDNYRIWILSQSVPTRPEWCPAAGFATKIVSDMYFGYARYRFSLLANPTRKIKALKSDGTAKKNGRREAIRADTDLRAWLQRKAKQGGFDVNVDSLKVIPRGSNYFSKSKSSGSHAAVEFQGVLTVQDRARFRETCIKGVGTAKAFGFGMLTIVPLEN